MNIPRILTEWEGSDLTSGQKYRRVLQSYNIGYGMLHFYLFIAACNFKNLNLKEQSSIQDLDIQFQVFTFIVSKNWVSSPKLKSGI